MKKENTGWVPFLEDKGAHIPEQAREMRYKDTIEGTKDRGPESSGKGFRINVPALEDPGHV